MKASRLHLLMPLALATMAWACSPARAADGLRTVTLHPQGASIERVAAVPANGREARFACLSPQLEAESIQVLANSEMRVGEARLELKAVDLLPECNVNPKLRELERQMAQLQQEKEAADVAVGFLRQLAPKDLPAGMKLADGVELLRRQSLDAYRRQAEVKGRIEALERDVAQVRASQSRSSHYHVLTVPVDTLRGGELRLQYRAPQAGWIPHYRARLDTQTGRVSVERLASVLQQTGEDWRDVALTLSTESGRSQGQPGILSPWLIDIRPKEEPRPTPLAFAHAPPAPPPPAPAPARAAAPALADPARERMNFTPSAFVGEFATQYALPGQHTLVSAADRRQFSLGTEQIPAEVYSRVQPLVDANAFLVAELSRPAGSWPQGRLQLLRDGVLVGESVLAFGGAAKVDWVFGRDERLRIRRIPERIEGANAGLIAQRQQRTVERTYEIENQVDKPIRVVALESTPVSRHEDIRVEQRFEPSLREGDWRSLPGIRAWDLRLAPKQALTLSARYQLSAPADARLTGWR